MQYNLLSFNQYHISIIFNEEINKINEFSDSNIYTFCPIFFFQLAVPLTANNSHVSTTDTPQPEKVRILIGRSGSKLFFFELFKDPNVTPKNSCRRLYRCSSSESIKDRVNRLQIKPRNSDQFPIHGIFFRA